MAQQPPKPDGLMLRIARPDGTFATAMAVFLWDVAPLTCRAVIDALPIETFCWRALALGSKPPHPTRRPPEAAQTHRTRTPADPLKPCMTALLPRGRRSEQRLRGSAGDSIAHLAPAAGRERERDDGAQARR
eukprot:6353217-Prymnesium_polylepis.1